MMDASWHALLDLPPDADERAIKRAYAAKLRITRPDVDPAGFQQLNEAYQAALALLQHRLAREAMAESNGGIDPAEDAPTATSPGEPPSTPAADGMQPDGEVEHDSTDDNAESEAGATEDGEDAGEAPQGNAITLDQFLDECLGAASDGDPRVLDHWLRSQPVLWSLEHKAMIGHWLLRLMDARQPPMTERNFDMLADFFGYNDLHAGYDPLALQSLRSRLIESWRELQAQRRWQRPVGDQIPASAFSFSSIARQQTQHKDEYRNKNEDEAREKSAFMHRLLRLHAYLTRPVGTWRNLWTSLNISRIASVREMLLVNPYGGPDQLPERIRRDQIAYWLAATDHSRWARERVLIAMFRCLMLSLPLFPLLLVIQKMGFDGRGMNWTMVLLALAWPWGTLMSAWLLLGGFRMLMYWQSGPDPDEGWMRRIHLLLVPTLAISSVVSTLFETLWPATYATGILACWLASARYFGWQRHHGKYRFRVLTPKRMSIILLATTVLFPFFIAELIPMTALTTTITLTLWTMDIIRSRKHR